MLHSRFPLRPITDATLERKGSPETIGFWRRFFAYFLSLLTKSVPSETKRKNCWEKYATGGASAIRNTVVSAGFQPLWGVKTGTLPRNRLAFSATGGASAIRNTVVSAGFQPFWGVKTGTLPRNRLAFSATGGASAIRNTVVSAGFQPLWGVKTGTLPRNRLAFSATGGASAIILAFSSRCAILNLSHIQRQSRDLRVAPMGA